MSRWKKVNFLDYIYVNPRINLDRDTLYPYIDMANTAINSRMPIASVPSKPKSGARFEKGDTIVARIEPCLQNGKGFYCNDIEKGFGSTEFLVFRPKDTSNFDSLFLYYLMKMPYIREAMANTMTGASGRQRVNNNVFASLQIVVPLNINVQRNIAIILSRYDTLIENCKNQIKLLEETAQRLYKEWFVDFRFPGSEHSQIINGVPRGWILKKLDDLIDFNPKYSISKDVEHRFFPMSSLNTTSMLLDYNECSTTSSVSGTKFSNGDTLLARITPCLENGKTSYVGGLHKGEVALGSTEFIVMRSKALNPYMVYLLARSENFRKTAINSMNGSDGRQRVQVDKLKLYPYTLPSGELIMEFGRMLKPIFGKIYNLNEQIFQAAEARDRLLPKLMSGEISIETAQSVTSELGVRKEQTGSPKPSGS